MQKYPAVAFLLFTLLNLSSCDAFRSLLGYGFQEPKVTVRGISVKKASFDRLDLLVDLRVKNPNDFELSLAKLSYQLVVQGSQELAHGVYSQPIKLGPEQQSDFALPVQVIPSVALQVIGDVMKNPKQDYPVVLSATAVFDSIVGKIEHTFTQEKSLSNFHF